MIKLPGGTIWLDAGERCPYQCPECKNFIEWKDVPAVHCDACGFTAPAKLFSEVRFEYGDQTVN